jgi:hypothetical protein
MSQEVLKIHNRKFNLCSFYLLQQKQIREVVTDCSLLPRIRETRHFQIKTDKFSVDRQYQI